MPFRNAHLQTILCSSRIRFWNAGSQQNKNREIVLETDNGVRLIGYQLTPKNRTAKGLVILLHGWEGSANSIYILRTARHLYRQGYAVFSLNYRDHGDSHHLNEDLFYATRLDEVSQAVQQVSRLLKKIPVFIVGFSLGGNFALRIARRCEQEGIDSLRHSVCISPVLDPDNATDKIDAKPYIRKYFLDKWRRSLLKKEELYPHRFDFSSMLHLNTIRALTEALLAKYSEFNSVKEYFDGYTLLNDALKDISVSTTIITAADDPIIGVGDFYKLQLNGLTNLAVQSYGGHNGFITGYSLASWYEQRIVELFDRIID